MKVLVRLSAAALPAMLFAAAALADPIPGLTGYWSGSGSIALSNGKTERVKCQVFYRSEGTGQLVQTMRCASPDYNINSLAELTLNGTKVSGTWEEKTYAAKGAVSGRYGGDTFSLSIQGANFSASMNVTVSNCRQSLTITPSGLEVSRVSITLAKQRCGG
ncbi:MAG TPA: hypothetical protein VG758_01215, partial [Hyphomicrobiaceae bacterium]|jgi:hypothetical protein|nr:hypothetical protein [Hyphomicrobiaceae bacterium]